MRLAIISNEELIHSPMIKRIVDYFSDHTDHTMEVMARNNLHHQRLKGVGVYFVLGGDGTLFTLTHYLQKGFIVGVHAGEDNSIGHFMGLSLAKEKLEGDGSLQEKMASLVNSIESNKDFTERAFVFYHRLKAYINKATGITVPVDMAFNEYAMGNNLFGRPSKYFLSVLSEGTRSSPGEWQRSSGVICSTLQGMSGWSRHIVAPSLPRSSDPSLAHNDNPLDYETIIGEYRRKVRQKIPEFFYMIREPMHRIEVNSGFTTKLTLTSDMAGGIISLDGFNEVPFERNDEVVVEVSDYPLWLLRKGVDFSEVP